MLLNVLGGDHELAAADGVGAAIGARNHFRGRDYGGHAGRTVQNAATSVENVGPVTGLQGFRDPLLDQQHLPLGAIVIQSYTPEHTYSDEDQALFAVIANHVSVALQSLQSMDRLERAVQERTARLAHEVAERRRAEQVQHALYQIANLSAGALDTNVLMASLHRIIGELMVVENFMIGLYHPDTQEISIPYFVDQKDAAPPLGRFPYGQGMCSYLLASKQPQLHDAGSFARLVASGQVAGIFGNVDIASWMGAPMLVHDKPYGVLIVQSCDPATVYTKADLDLLAFIASHVAVAIARMSSPSTSRRIERVLLVGGRCGWT